MSTVITRRLIDLINETFITAQDAAKLKGCSRSDLYQLIERGRLRTEIICGKTMVYRDEVVGFVKNPPGPKKAVK